MLDSSSPNLLRASGIKRLLPAFEPSSSPPRFKRQKSRPAPAEEETENRYPTPLPSSSIGLLPSSPPPAPSRRPLLKRSQSTVSERAPLSAVPSITLPLSGESVLLGRSSNSSHYRLSANRLISRVHIRATYFGATPAAKPKIELRCLGWNGVKVHCQGRAWELQKDDIFMSETEHAEIMLDVHDSRVVIMWPAPTAVGAANNCSPQGPPSGRVARSPSLDWEAGNDESADSWELARRVNARVKLTPVSPLPARRSHHSNTNSLIQDQSSASETFLDIYEDEPEVEGELPALASKDEETIEKDVGEAMTEMVPKSSAPVPADDYDEDDEDILSSDPEDNNEEADEPIVVRPDTPPPPPVAPRRRRRSASPSKSTIIQNHLTNQLAFSRVNSLPLSELYSNLPADIGAAVTIDCVKKLLSEAACIGEIKRVGKDAAGKPLEYQYYYMMDQDRDEGRKASVGGRSGMRTCRKTHKVC